MSIVYLFLFFFTGLKGGILEVGSGGPYSYVGVQPALDASTHGDTILVWPGTYLGALDFNGKNVLLTSFYLYDSTNASIRETILDGNREGSVVMFNNDETRDAILNGFTITNGSGYVSSLGSKYGGGIYIQDSSPTLNNCIIRDNYIFGDNATGGGMYIVEHAAPYLSNLVVTHNFSEWFGGGIFSAAASTEFDPVNRCSIFLNHSGSLNDLRIGDPWEPLTEVYLDTFTIAYADSFYVSGDMAVFDVLNHKIELVDHDLYVAPWGDNLNSGLTADEPLQNIYWALEIIKENPINPNTIYLSPGLFSKNNSGEFFALNTKSYVSIIGSVEDSTILSLDEEFSRGIDAGQREKYYSIENLHLRNQVQIDPDNFNNVINVDMNTGLIIKNISVKNIINFFRSSHNTINGPANFDIEKRYHLILDKINIQNNEMVSGFSFCCYDVATIKNSTLINNSTYTYSNGISMGTYLIHFYSGSDYNDYLRLENNLIVNNINSVSEDWGPVTVLSFVGPQILEMVNNTIMNNTGEQTGNIEFEYRIQGSNFFIVNNIFWGNEMAEFIISNPYNTTNTNLVFSHNIIEDGEGGFIGDYPDNVVWEGGNLENDPQFSNDEDNPYTLNWSSPAINAGTAYFEWNVDTMVNLSSNQYNGSAPDIGAFEFGPPLSSAIEILPENFQLYPPYPNPFNPITTIRFNTGENSLNHVALKVFDINGKRVASIVNGYLPSGDHEFLWDASEFSSGVYFIKLNVLSILRKKYFTKTEKVLLLK